MMMKPPVKHVGSSATMNTDNNSNGSFSFGEEVTSLYNAMKEESRGGNAPTAASTAQQQPPTNGASDGGGVTLVVGRKAAGGGRAGGGSPPQPHGHRHAESGAAGASSSGASGVVMKRMELMQKIQEGGGGGGGQQGGGNKNGGAADGGSGSSSSACVFQSLQLDGGIIDSIRSTQQSSSSSSTTATGGALTANNNNNVPSSTVGQGGLDDAGGLEPMGAMFSSSGGRKMRGGGGGAGSRSSNIGGGQGEGRPFQIVIPLSSTEKLGATTASGTKKMLQNEYGARYCEAIGIAPTQQNISAILKHMPLEQCRVSQMFHPGLGRGERRNNIVIQPSYYVPPAAIVKQLSDADGEAEHLKLLDEACRRRGRGDGGDFGGKHHGFTADADDDDEDSTGLNGKSEATKGTGSSSASKKKASSSSSSSTTHHRDRHLPQFDDYKHRYVYPFSLRDRFEKLVVEEPTEAQGGGEEQGEHTQAGKKNRGLNYAIVTVSFLLLEKAFRINCTALPPFDRSL